MEQIRIVGLDIAKSVFQVHGVDGESTVVVRRRLKRSQVLRYFASIEPCRIGIEACATAHFWARELGALGHDVKLMPPAYVKPYVKRQKNDAADAEAYRAGQPMDMMDKPDGLPTCPLAQQPQQDVINRNLAA